VGTIRERSPGHFELRVFVGKSPSGSPRYVQDTYVHHRKDGGIAAARRRLSALEKEAAGRKTTSTFGVLLDEWLAHAKKIGRSPTTLDGYGRRVRAIKKALGSVELGALTARDLDTWYGQLLEEKKSAADVMAYHRVISAALSQGEKWDAVERNVARRASLPTVPEVVIDPPTPQQVKTLIVLAEQSKTPEMASIIFWAALTGMRRGEICGFRWNKVDWESARVHVSHAVWQLTGEVGEKDTKSHQARWVEVEREGLYILQARWDRAVEDAAAAELEVAPDGYVWSSDLIGAVPWNPDRITQAFKRLTTRAGWPQYRLHDLRHYMASELLDAGVPLHTVQRRLGHRNASTTANIYGHGREESDRKAAKVVAKGLAGPRKALPKSPQKPRSAVRSKPRKS
jgi:integrase